MDTLNFTIGAVLLQVSNNCQKHLIANGSKTLSLAQLNYSTIKKELLAEVTIVEHFKHFILGQKFTVQADHKALKWFMKSEALQSGRYMVVDCGGGTVDITVHEITNREGQLKELFKASGGPYGSITVDEAFENLLDDIFGRKTMETFKLLRPSGFIELMIAFESRKRGYSPKRSSSVNVSLPYSFIDFLKSENKDPAETIRKFEDTRISWGFQGVLRLQTSVVNGLFKKSIEKILEHINSVLDCPNIAARYFALDLKRSDPPSNNEAGIGHLFLVGGFAESPVVREAIKKELAPKLKVVIPQGVGVAVLRGAVLYGLDPSVVYARRAMKTYGFGVIRPFLRGMHPPEKRVIKDGLEWCMDVFDKFVTIGDSVILGEAVTRSYRPASPKHRHIEIHIFSSENENDKFITDPGVEMCGSLSMDLSEGSSDNERRVIQAKMSFGDTEIKISAHDVSTKQTVRVNVDFLNENNPKYSTRL